MGRVVVIGAHGRTGAHVVTRLLAAGHDVVGTVRDASQVSSLVTVGAAGAVVDLMTATRPELRAVMASANAVVYAAGSGWGDPRRVVERLDRDAIITAADAAVAAGLERFVLVSAHRADDDLGDHVVDVLLRAKRAADAYLRSSPLGWTIIRPDALTEGAPSGRVHVGETVPHGALPRADLAAVIETALRVPATVRRQFEIVGGTVSIADALNWL